MSSKSPDISVGQRVNYVMADGQIRPFDVVVVNDEKGESVSGYVLVSDTDSYNVPEGADYHCLTITFAPLTSRPIPMWLAGVKYDESNKPGTYHLDEEE